MREMKMKVCATLCCVMCLSLLCLKVATAGFSPEFVPGKDGFTGWETSDETPIGQGIDYTLADDDPALAANNEYRWTINGVEAEAVIGQADITLGKGTSGEFKTTYLHGAIRLKNAGKLQGWSMDGITFLGAGDALIMSLTFDPSHIADFARMSVPGATGQSPDYRYEKPAGVTDNFWSATGTDSGPAFNAETFVYYNGDEDIFYFAAVRTALHGVGIPLTLDALHDRTSKTTFVVGKPTDAAVPEPATLALFGLGAASIPMVRRFRRK